MTRTEEEKKARKARGKSCIIKRITASCAEHNRAKRGRISTTTSLLGRVPETHSGLLRRRRLLRGWSKPRRFTIKSGYLLAHPGSAEATQPTVIDLDGCTVQPLTEKEKRKETRRRARIAAGRTDSKGWKFTLLSPAGCSLMHLKATTEEERTAWVKHLSAVRRRHLSDFRRIATLGEGAYGKVMLVRETTASAATTTPHDAVHAFFGDDEVAAAKALASPHKHHHKGSVSSAASTLSSASSATRPMSGSTASAGSLGAAGGAGVGAGAGADSLASGSVASSDPLAAAGAGGGDGGRFYALKEISLQSEGTRGASSVQRAAEERAILQMAGAHPYITQLHYAFVENGRLHYVQGLGQGGDLYDNLRAAPGHRFSEDAVRVMAGEMVLAIGHLHELGILHRDIKLENVLLDTAGHVMLADFGLAKALPPKLMRSYSFVGTERYCPPEMYLNVAHGRAVDWWQLGCLIFELLTGRPPFYSRNRERQRASILAAVIHFPDHVSESARSLISGLLKRNTWERLGAGPEDAAEVKSQAFFDGMDWDALLHKRVAPVYVPPSSSSPLGNLARADAEAKARQDADGPAPKARSGPSCPIANWRRGRKARQQDRFRQRVEQEFIGFDYAGDDLLVSDDEDDDHSAHSAVSVPGTIVAVPPPPPTLHSASSAPDRVADAAAATPAASSSGEAVRVGDAASTDARPDDLLPFEEGSTSVARGMGSFAALAGIPANLQQPSAVTRAQTQFHVNQVVMDSVAMPSRSRALTRTRSL